MESDSGLETDRGFPGAVIVWRWQRLVAALPTLSAACPAVHIAFPDDFQPENVQAAVDRGLAGWCRGLDIRLGDEGQADLVRHPGR